MTHVVMSGLRSRRNNPGCAATSDQKKKMIETYFPFS